MVAIQRYRLRLRRSMGRLAIIIGLFPWGAAGALTFQVESLFSTADGAVQFIILREAQGQSGQNALAGLTLTAQRAGVVHAFRFPSDLPSPATAGRRVLIGTESFAVRGLVAPDYVVPDRFLPTDGAVLDFAGSDAVSYAALPTDGVNALLRDGSQAANQATNFAGTSARVPYGPVTAIEYYNATLDHYFVSPLAPDIDALDSRRLPGWNRSGQSFAVYPTGTTSDVRPVCRFYIPPQHGDSHFFSASTDECAEVLARIETDPNFSGYVYETPNAFFVALPNAGNGACPEGTSSVYRLWNARADSNHRYTASATIKAQMVAAGYTAEGYGPDGVAMCAPVVTAGAAIETIRVSQSSPFPAGCTAASGGVVYANAEVEPYLAVNPANPNNLIGVWQQDRWSNGGANGLVTGFSLDGGRTWAARRAPFSRCAGGSYARASDPWVTFSPDGTAYQVALAFSGGARQPGSSSAVLVSRSFDGGDRWSEPLALTADGSAFFNDKESIAADPSDARYVYVVWDRLTSDNRGPTLLARTTDGGASWDTAREVYDPGTATHTINNQVVVLPDGTAVLFFTRLDARASGAEASDLVLMRSQDHGATWSAPIVVGSIATVGTRDPQTRTRIRDGSTLGSIAAGRNGQLAIAWQDARFGGPSHDGIAFSMSLDGGLTWSAPRGINAAPAAAAFMPAVTIRDDGAIGVTYYDLRNNTPDAATIWADFWLTQSTDGINWRERHVAGPFDLSLAPIADGLFVGDYHGLAHRGAGFMPLYATTDAATPQNRTDLYLSIVPEPGRAELGAPASAIIAREAVVMPRTAVYEQRLRDAVKDSVARRLNRGFESTRDVQP